MSSPHDPPRRIASFRFYAELNDFLPGDLRHSSFDYPFSGSPGIKDVIEAIGVPHPEIDLIVAGGVSVAFDYRLQDGDVVSVYPVFEAIDISPAVRLRPEPLRVTRFIADIHLGKLARALRLLGFDTVCEHGLDDADIIRRARDEHRIILTRGLGLLKSGDVTHGYWVRSTDPREQAEEVVARLQLRSQFQPFSRCTVCNGPIAPADTDEARREAPPKVRHLHTEFHRCGSCGKLYWKGSHYDRLKAFVAQMTRQDDGV